LTEVSDAKFWLHVPDHNSAESDQIETLSTLISCFCNQHRESLDIGTFTKLTEESAISKISSDAAIDLLSMNQASEYDYVILERSSDYTQQTNRSR